MAEGTRSMLQGLIHNTEFDGAQVSFRSVWYFGESFVFLFLEILAQAHFSPPGEIMPASHFLVKVGFAADSASSA